MRGSYEQWFGQLDFAAAECQRRGVPFPFEEQDKNHCTRWAAELPQLSSHDWDMLEQLGWTTTRVIRNEFQAVVGRYYAATNQGITEFLRPGQVRE